jgi:hypothetical protein
MWTAKWILDAYEEGDESARGDLYMTYRDLRPCFDEMENSAQGKDKSKPGDLAERSAGPWWHYCARLVKG